MLFVNICDLMQYLALDLFKKNPINPQVATCKPVDPLPRIPAQGIQKTSALLGFAIWFEVDFYAELTWKKNPDAITG